MTKNDNQFQADDEELLRSQATNPLTSPKRLEQLSQHSNKTLRRLVALNPSTPIETLWKLGIEFPQEVLNHPVLLLLRSKSSIQPNILEGLFNLMNDDQKLTFKKAVVQQTIHYVTQQLPPLEQDEGERSYIELAQQWLENPTEEVASRANFAAIASCIDGGVRYHDYSKYFLEPAWAAGADTGLEAIKYALTAATPSNKSGFYSNDEELEEKSAHQWQIATVWAILYDKPLPPLP